MLKYFKYNIPFEHPFKVAGAEFTHREGIILVYRDSGIEAYGEVAPLPGFSSESLAEVEEVLKMNREHLQQTIRSGDGTDTLNVLDQIHQFPSLSFGLDTLLHDLAAKNEGESLVQYLFPKFNNQVTCNATLPIQNKSESLSKAQELIEQGFDTLKIKVGDDLLREVEIIKVIRQQYPDLKIRIDANQAWTKNQAIRNLGELEPFYIEYCEQPVPKDQISALKEVKDAVKIPIAADESVRNKRSVLELSESNAADLLILKPMLMGTFDNIFVTKQVTDTHNIETIFTTSLETAVGRAATVALSAGLGSKDRAQGLATGAFLSHDLAREDWLNKPAISFPKSKGLGILLHLEGLKEL